MWKRMVIGGAVTRDVAQSAMRAESNDPVLVQAAETLDHLLGEAEREIGTLAGTFEDLAREINGALESAAQVVRCAEEERLQTVLARVRRLEEETATFLEERLSATAGILKAVKEEAVLLGRLERQTQAQRGIARETEMLRVLTNIEVARLGEVGAGFEYLAQELNDFSAAVTTSTGELLGHTRHRRRTVEETRRTLEMELPRMQEEFAGVERELRRAGELMESTLRQLGEAPERFRGSVVEIAAQIAGVVAGIQSHDITRQQMEHVRDALRMIATAMQQPEEAAVRQAGLRIQSYQLRSIRATMEQWTAQIGRCLEDMSRVATGEILDLAPAVLREEQELGAELGRIESLAERCGRADEKVRRSFAGIAGLMQLVNEHLARSKGVRDRLQLLMFNSIVEASHLGGQADGILEISTTIKRISAEWSRITGASEQALAEIAALVEGSGAARAIFAEGRCAALSIARAETHAGLQILSEAGRCAERQGQQIQEGIATVLSRIAGIGSARDRLESSFRSLTEVLATLELASGAMEPGGNPAADTETVERRFAAGYTTEMERAVLRAALAGAPLPASQPHLEGNSVELF